MYCFNETTAPLEPNEWFDSSGSIIAAGNVPAFTNSNKLSQCECATGAVGTQAGWVNNNDVIVDIFKNSTMSTSNSDYYRDGPDIYTESIANNSLLFEMTDTDKTTAKKVCEYYGMTFDTTATNNFLYQGNNTTHQNEDANILWTTSATPVISGVTKTLSTISAILTPAPSQANWYAINGLAGSGASALQCRITPTSAPTTTVAEKKSCVPITCAGSETTLVSPQTQTFFSKSFDLMSHSIKTSVSGTGTYTNRLM